MRPLFRRRKPEFDLRPGHGAGPLSFAISRHTAESRLGALGIKRTARHGASDYYLENALELEFEDDALWFIGLSPAAKLIITLNGTRLDGRPAQEVARLLSMGEPDAPGYDPGEMLFPVQILTLWDADPQYHPRETEPAWAQIGIGDARYLAAIQAIGQS